MYNYLNFFENDEEIRKSFNTTGLCISEKHYMVNIDHKLKSIIKLVQRSNYFVINRPRQYGKTTTLHRLEEILRLKYKVISIDFEGLGRVFENERKFCAYFIKAINEQSEFKMEVVSNFVDLAGEIRKITVDREIVLIVDEVDRASNNTLFLEFLGMLRSLFLSRAKGSCTSFKSVILAGVHDIKNLKIKFSEGSEVKYNSPWNIAVNFNVNMSFNEYEIATMLDEYCNDNNIYFDINVISKEIYKYTSGYPFLVSRICQVIDEDLMEYKKDKWTIKHIEKAVKKIMNEKNMLFDELIKSLENDSKLYTCVYNMIKLQQKVMFNINNPIIELGYMMGYFTYNNENQVVMSNYIIKQVVNNYIDSKEKESMSPKEVNKNEVSNNEHSGKNNTMIKSSNNNNSNNSSNNGSNNRNYTNTGSSINNSKYRRRDNRDIQYRGSGLSGNAIKKNKKT